MAALTTYGAENRVIDSGLVVTKDWQFVFGTWTGKTVVESGEVTTYTSMRRYRRRATASYRYVGMTRAAAETCLKAMEALYRTSSTARQKYAYIWNSTAGTMGDWQTYRTDGIDCARCELVYDGIYYSVVVTIDEEDFIWSKTAITPDWTFADSRSYDGLA